MRLLLTMLVVCLVLAPVASADGTSTTTNTDPAPSDASIDTNETGGPEPSGCRPYCVT